MFNRNKKFNGKFLFATILSIAFAACFATVFIFYLNYRKDGQMLYKRMTAVSESIGESINERFEGLDFTNIGDGEIKEIEKLLKNYITANGVCSMVLVADKDGEIVHVLSLWDGAYSDGKNESGFEGKYLAALNGEFITISDLAKFSGEQFYRTFAPIKDKDGNITAAVYLKYDLTHLNKKELEFIVNGFCALLCASAALVLFINLLNKKLAVPFLRRLAYIDILSNLKNRTAFEEEFTELNSKRGDFESIILALFDLNNLKDINDIYGHDAGDNYIKEFSKYFSKSFFKVGECYRTGGDEFVLIVNNNTEQEKIELLIKEVLYKIKEANTLYWFAYGIASYDKENDGDLHRTLERADTVMYENKRIFKTFMGFNR